MCIQTPFSLFLNEFRLPSSLFRFFSADYSDWCKTGSWYSKQFALKWIFCIHIVPTVILFNFVIIALFQHIDLLTTSCFKCLLLDVWIAGSYDGMKSLRPDHYYMMTTISISSEDPIDITIWVFISFTRCWPCSQSCIEFNVECLKFV